MRAFDRLLVKVPEHTWGLAQSWFTADYQNYTNSQFQAALKDSLTAGPLQNQSDLRGGAAQWRADYYTTVQAWHEQRSYITNAVGAVAIAEAEAAAAAGVKAHDAAGTDAGKPSNAAVGEAEGSSGRAATSALGVPTGWAEELTARLAALSDVPEPSAQTLRADGYRQVPLSDAGTGVLQCAGAEVGFDTTGAIVHLVNNAAEANMGSGTAWGGAGASASWANATRPIGQFLYQSFDDDDYQAFLGPAPAGFGVPGCTPSSTNYALCGNFNRPNMTAANPQHIEATAVATSIWQLNASSGTCSFAVEATMDPRLHVLAGAPSKVWALFDVRPGASSMAVDMELRMFNKTATRLPESIMVVFRPAFEFAGGARGKPAAAGTGEGESVQQRAQREQLGHGWLLEMFNETNITLDPTDVVVNGHGSGGAPHTRCISGVVRRGPRHGKWRCAVHASKELELELNWNRTRTCTRTRTRTCTCPRTRTRTCTYTSPRTRTCTRVRAHPKNQSWG